MSNTESNKLLQSNCDNLKLFRDILLQNDSSTKTKQIPVEALVDTLYSEHFQLLFTYRDEKVVCNKRRDGTTEASPIPPTNDDLWIFGYGSLVWKTDFPYIDKKQGYIEGYQRRFFQHSIDHRGTPDKPGRVVTLVPSSSRDCHGRVYGVAYRIAKENTDEVLAHLDYREKNGYQRSTLRFVEFCSGKTIDIIMYIATNENDSFAGGNEDDLQPIADQIYTSAGPSGPNREYLYYLADAMRQLFPGVVDEHLFKLEEMVKRREQRDKMLANVIKSEIRAILMMQNVDNVVQKFNELLANCKIESYLEELLNKTNCDR